jgi:hypothetical protein
MRSSTTYEFMSALAIAQQFGQPPPDAATSTRLPANRSHISPPESQPFPD